MYKKLTASLIATVMVASILGAAVVAKPLNTYPTFLGKIGDFYIVVGEAAAASDVAGAIDIAANLAQLSYKETAVTTTAATALTGIERKIAIPTSASGGQVGGTSANQLPSVLRNYHYSGLKQGQIDYKGTKYNYHEMVVLGATTPQMTHKLGDPVNGTLKMKIDTGSITYKYQFDSAIPFGYTSANATSYQTPLQITVAGQDFSIVAIPSQTSFVALVGTVKWLSEGESLTAGDLTLKLVAAYSGTKAKVEITDSAGNIIWSGMVTSTETSITHGTDTYKVKVLDSAPPTVAGVAGIAQIVFGKGDVEKTFDGSDTATIAAWGSDWKIAGQFAAAGNIAAGDNITVTYSPAVLEEKDKYKVAGDVFKGPGDYFELSYAGLYPGDFAKITIAPVTGKTVYNSTAATGYSTESGLNGLEISSDVAGSIVYSATGYDKVYVLFGPAQSSNFNGTTFRLAYWDKTTSRIVNLTAPATINTAGGYRTFSFTLSYGGPGATTSFTLNGTFDDDTLLAQVGVWDSSNQQVSMAFQNRAAAASGTVPEIILGSTAAKADTNDVQARVEGSSTDISSQLKDVITDGGVQVYTVKSNADSDKVVIGIPPETVYAKVQFGKIGETTEAKAGTVKEVVAVTTPVAKLDTEVTDAIKTTKNLVTVGGPCINKVTADALGLTYPACGAASTIPENAAIIKVIDDKFATGKVVVVVAGWSASDTRLASSVLQAYAEKLKDITADSVKVSGTTLATATITPQ